MKLTKKLASCLLLLTAAALVAAPLSFTPVRITQPDGSEVDIFASGDEFHNWLHDSQNYTIVQNDEGWYVYARQDGEGVAPTDLVAGSSSPGQRGLRPGINLSQNLIRQKYDRYSSMRDYSNAKSPHTGQFNNLVVFIKFADDTEFTSPLSVYEEIFNNPSGNSMKRFFNEASYNQLNVDSFFYPIPDGDVIISYTDSYERNYFRPYSVTNPQGYSGDGQRTEREHQLLLRAVTAIAPQIPASMVIDGDNDGYVDNTCFIIRGGTDGWAELLWPHRWVLYTVNAMINGKRVWDFNFQIETSTLASGAGVLSHEMFHSLGAPDLYRYNDNTIDPIGAWDLMCSDQNPPQHMSVWMKYRYGQWLTEVPEITQSGTYTLSPVASSATNNIYRVPSWRNGEYYLLEYRKASANYDHNIPGYGLLVYRLDVSESGNASGPPDELYIYRPYGVNTTTNGMLGQAGFSAQSGRTELSEATSPNGFMSNNAPGGLNLYDVGEAGETITFKVKISDIQLTQPHGGETWFSGSNKSISWKSKATTGSVTVEYSLDGGNQWTVLTSTGSPNGSHVWTNIPILNTTQAHIRVTLNSNGHSDSNVYPFTILSEVAVPEGTWPENGATGVPTNPLLRWTGVAGVTGYQFQVSDNQDFDSYLVNIMDHPTSSYQLSELQPYQNYYWRVCSISELGIGPFCQTMSFTTGNITDLPAPPQLVFPSDLATGLPLEITFNWEPQSLADSYAIQVTRDPWFASVDHYIQGIGGTSVTVSSLNYNTNYFWRVSSSNVAGSSLFSPIRRFTTMQGTAVDDPGVLPPRDRLEQNYPNPFNPSTTITFSLKDPSAPAELRIFNLKGQLVRTLYKGIPGGRELKLVWDGKDEQGRDVASGIYHYKLSGGGFSKTRKMLLLK